MTSVETGFADPPHAEEGASSELAGSETLFVDMEEDAEDELFATQAIEDPGTRLLDPAFRKRLLSGEAELRETWNEPLLTLARMKREKVTAALLVPF